jgi:hypothetical protein
MAIRAGGVSLVWAICVMVLATTMAGDHSPDRMADPQRSAPLAPPNKLIERRTVSEQERADAIARAQVWHAPNTPIARADLGAPRAGRTMDCWFTISELGGTTPKFRCVLGDGREVRAKYGPGSEIPGEAAATRLLAALGFGADHVFLTERLRCFGCPLEPFVTMKVVEATRTKSLYARLVDHDAAQEFEWVAIEERFTAPPIETEEVEGWGFFELDKVEESKGGAPRAHVDALRLMAIFLAHWDNKPANQRLVCLSSNWPEGEPCEKPFLMLQDVGSTFGPRKVDLDAWEQAAIWKDRTTCTVSMEDMPHGGSTFAPIRISERGRQFLSRQLTALTDAQLTRLFSSARFDQRRVPIARPSPVAEWVRVFRQRVQTISSGPACPA